MEKISHSEHPHNKEIVSTLNAEYFDSNSDWKDKSWSVAQVALDFINEEAFQTNESREDFLQKFKKISELGRPLLEQPSEKAWDHYIDKKGLEYDKLTKDFFKALPTNVLTTLAAAEVAKVHKAETGQSATPPRRLIGTNIMVPQSIETLSKLCSPGKMMIYTRKDHPNEFNQAMAAHYAKRAIFMEKYISSIGLYMTNCNKICMILDTNPNPSLPDTK